MVIPTTSKTRKETKSVFSVGNISGLYGSSDTTLLISDMTRVSRKRLYSLTPYRHPKKGNVPARLPMSWNSRILDGIVSTYASTPTFEEVLMYTTQTAMVSDLRIFKDWRFKTGFGKFDDSSNILHFNRWNEDKSNPLQLIQPNIQISKDMKIQLMKELFDQDPHVRTNAEARYAEWYSEKI